MTRTASIVTVAVAAALGLAVPRLSFVPASAAVPAPAQAPPPAGPTTTPGAHVDVDAAPKVVLPGQPVVISGSTGYSQKQNQAAVVVRHESGTPSATLTAAVSANGAFKISFANTQKPGKFEVTVTAPDGKGKGSTEFRVTSIASLAGDVEKLAIELDKRTKALVKFVKDTAVALPASPERDQLIAETQQLEQKANAVGMPPKILAELKKLVPQPNATTLPDQAVFGELRDWVPKAEEGIEEIDRARIGEKPTPICETINTAIEGAKFASYAFAITGNLLTTLMKIGIDKGVPALVDQLGFQANASLALSSGIKVSAEGLNGAVQAATAAVTGLTDLVEHFTKWMFSRYCGSFDGPLGVSMTMVWNEGIQPWLKYGVRLDGRFRLRFPKETAAGKPVYMTGELEGNATNFTFWENVTVAEPLPKSVLPLQRLWLKPVSFLNSPASPVDFGMVARAVTPAYFNVPVIAEMTGDTVKMQFKEARVDFSSAVKNRLLFAVMTPLMPDFKVFTFPIEKAHWILSKGFSDPSILKVTEAGGVKGIRLNKMAAHRQTANKSVVVDWVIDVDARKSGDGPQK